VQVEVGGDGRSQFQQQKIAGLPSGAGDATGKADWIGLGGGIAAIGALKAEVEPPEVPKRGESIHTVEGGQEIGLAVLGRVVDKRSGAVARTFLHDDNDPANALLGIRQAIAFRAICVHIAVAGSPETKHPGFRALAKQRLVIRLVYPKEMNATLAPNRSGFVILQHSLLANDKSGELPSVCRETVVPVGA